MKAGSAIKTMVVLTVLALAFAVAGCAGPQERAGTDGDGAAQSAGEAKPSRTGAAIPPLPSDGNYDCANFEREDGSGRSITGHELHFGERGDAGWQQQWAVDGG